VVCPTGGESYGSGSTYGIARHYKRGTVMATTDTIWTLEPGGRSPPATLAATFDTIASTDTPVAIIPVLDFDTTTSEWMYWFVTVPSHYDGGGFTISWKGGTDHASSVGTFIGVIRIVKLADAVVLTGDHTLDSATGVSITDTPPSSPTNKLNYSTTGTISHANAGSPAVGDRMGISFNRDVSDTNTGDLQLAEVLILET